MDVVHKTLSNLNSNISDFQTLLDEIPQPRFAHLIFNWQSEDQLKEVIPHVDIATLFPNMVVSVDHHAPPLVCKGCLKLTISANLFDVSIILSKTCRKRQYANIYSYYMG
jgi:hypothetical protein